MCLGDFGSAFPKYFLRVFVMGAGSDLADSNEMVVGPNFMDSRLAYDYLESSADVSKNLIGSEHSKDGINFLIPKNLKAEAIKNTKPEMSELAYTDGKTYFPILMYHHIAPNPHNNSYYVSPEIFDQQMAWIRDNNYNVISYEDLYLALAGEGTLPTNPTVITFDDGDRDQYTYAFPILQKYGYTATFFIIINHIGDGSYMTWDMIKELRDAGMTIGSHSVYHDDMAKMGGRQLKYELQESKKILEDELGIPINFFCYPGGAFSSAAVEKVKEAGYVSAVTTVHRVFHEIADPYDLFVLARFHVDDDMPSFVDWIQGVNLY